MATETISENNIAVENVASKLVDTVIDPDTPWGKLPILTSVIADFTDLEVQASGLDFKLLHNDNELGVLSREGLRRLGWHSLFKSDFVVGKLDRDLAIEVINHRLKKTDGTFQVIIGRQGGKRSVLNFVPEARELLDTRLVGQVIWDVLKSSFKELDCKVHLTEAGCRYEFTSKTEFRVTPQLDDIMGYTIRIDVEPGGFIDGSVFAKRLACLNGMTVEVDKFSWQKRSEADLESQLVWIQTVAIKAAEMFETITQKCVDMAAIKLEGDIEEILRSRARNIGVSESKIDELIEAWNTEQALGTEFTEWGVFNALTRYATHDEKLSDSARERLWKSCGSFANQFKMVTATLPAVTARKVGAQLVG